MLVSGNREKVNKNKPKSTDVRRSSASVLLSVAAKLRVVAGRDLKEIEITLHYGLKADRNNRRKSHKVREVPR